MISSNDDGLDCNDEALIEGEDEDENWDDEDGDGKQMYGDDKNNDWDDEDDDDGQMYGLISRSTDKATPPYQSALSLSFNQTNLFSMKCSLCRCRWIFKQANVILLKFSLNR